MPKIRKVIIPAAGFGTRFLPQTKAMPKEMLPVVDKPIIQYVVEEAVLSGIEDIIIVTGWHKRSIEDHFDTHYELEAWLEQAGKEKVLEELRQISKLANFIYIRQKGAYGNATPVLCAREVIGEEPFAVMWGDEFITAQPPRLLQMIKVFEKYGHPVISGVRIPKKDLHRYGIADLKPWHQEKKVYQIKKIVEKPTSSEAPSDLATHGAYILPPEIFPILENLKPGKGGELWLVDAIDKLLEIEPVLACEIENGKYYDTGDKLEYLKTVVEFALSHPDLNGPFRDYLKHLKI